MDMNDTHKPAGTWEEYRKRFGRLFREFIRDVLLEQVDHHMALVGFHRLDDEPLESEADEDLEERTGVEVLVYRYCDDRTEFDLRFAVHPTAGIEFIIDFEEAGMLIYSGPYDELEPDGWEAIRDSIQDGRQDLVRLRERQRFRVVK